MGTTLRIVLLALALVAPAQAQDPADIIMQYFCQVAGMKPVEEGTCGVLCKGLEAVTEIPEAICMPLMENGWEYLEADCKPNVTAVTVATEKDDPTPSDVVEKLLCKLAQSKEAKTSFATEVCSALVSQEKIEQEACDEAFEKLWDAVAAKCPSPPTSTIVV